MTGGIKCIHRAGPEKEKPHNGQSEIGHCHIFCDHIHTGAHQILGNARDLRIEELSGVIPKHGYKRHHEDDDADAADPLCKASPKMERLRKSFNVEQRGATCCGEAAHGLEKGIGERRYGTAEHKGKCAKECHHQPRHGDGQVYLPLGYLPGF